MSHMHQSTGPTPDPFLKELITSLSVTDRPDLMIFRKFSEAGKNMPKLRKKQKGSAKPDGEDGSTIVSSRNALSIIIYPAVNKCNIL